MVVRMETALMTAWLFVMVIITSSQEHGQLETECNNPVWFDDGSEYCCGITCPPGYIAQMCERGQPNTSQCRMCSHHTFRNDKAVLGNNDKCTLKKNCEQDGMYYTFPGNHTHDAQCGCLQGFHKRDKSLHGDLVCEKDLELGITDGLIGGNNNTVRDTQPTDNEESGEVPGYVIVIVAMALGIVLMCLFWFWTPCRSCSGASVGETDEDEESMIGKPTQGDTFTEGWGTDLDKDDQRKVIEHLLYKYIPAKLKSTHSAANMCDYLFRHLDQKSNLNDVAKDELKNNQNDMMEKIAQCLKHWHNWRGSSDPYVEVLDALRKEGLDYRDALNEINRKFPLDCQYHF